MRQGKWSIRRDSLQFESVPVKKKFTSIGNDNYMLEIRRKSVGQAKTSPKSNTLSKPLIYHMLYEESEMNHKRLISLPQLCRPKDRRSLPYQGGEKTSPQDRLMAKYTTRETGDPTPQPFKKREKHKVMKRGNFFQGTTDRTETRKGQTPVEQLQGWGQEEGWIWQCRRF